MTCQNTNNDLEAYSGNIVTEDWSLFASLEKLLDPNTALKWGLPAWTSFNNTEPKSNMTKLYTIYKWNDTLNLSTSPRDRFYGFVKLFASLEESWPSNSQKLARTHDWVHISRKADAWASVGSLDGSKEAINFFNRNNGYNATKIWPSAAKKQI